MKTPIKRCLVFAIFALLLCSCPVAASAPCAYASETSEGTEEAASLELTSSNTQLALPARTYTYTGSPIEPAPRVAFSSDEGAVALERGKDYTVSYQGNIAAGTGCVIVTGTGDYTGAVEATFTIAQAEQALKVSKASKTVIYQKLKKKKRSVKPIKGVAGAQGTVRYKLLSAKLKSKSRKSKFKISAMTGKVTVKKGTARGTYKLKVRVSSAATPNYTAAAKTASVIVTVEGYFAHPCPKGTVSSGYGYRSFNNAFHKGVDFAAKKGTPTYAAADGTVIAAGWAGTAGKWVVIRHKNGLVTKYMHHSSVKVRVGQKVKKGQKIGKVGSTGHSTGPHLHFQVEHHGSAINPYKYL